MEDRNDFVSKITTPVQVQIANTALPTMECSATAGRVLREESSKKAQRPYNLVAKPPYTPGLSPAASRVSCHSSNGNTLRQKLVDDLFIYHCAALSTKLPRREELCMKVLVRARIKPHSAIRPGFQSTCSILPQCFPKRLPKTRNSLPVVDVVKIGSCSWCICTRMMSP